MLLERQRVAEKNITAHLLATPLRQDGCADQFFTLWWRRPVARPLPAPQGHPALTTTIEEALAAGTSGSADALYDGSRVALEVAHGGVASLQPG